LSKRHKLTKKEVFLNQKEQKNCSLFLGKNTMAIELKERVWLEEGIENHSIIFVYF
jgi:hypothetical protein